MIQYRILGPLSVEGGVAGSDDPVDLGPPKQRALLAVLLLHANQIVPTDHLVESLWGQTPPRTALHSIQIYVSALRRALNGGATAIETRHPGYLLRADPLSIDMRRFEAEVSTARHLVHGGEAEAAVPVLESALGLWRGSALADFVYEEFAQAAIRDLTEARLEASELLARAELERGRAARAVQVARAVVEEAPLRESARSLLMLALYRSGRQAESLRAFHEFRELLVVELGTSPSPSLERLEEQVLLHDPALGEVEGAVPGLDDRVRNPFKGLRPFEEADSGDFFGRERLVAELVARVRAGAALLAVVGPSGSGKSSILSAGLVPRLRGSGWRIVRILPGPHPLDELHRALPPGDALDVRARMSAGLHDGQRMLVVVDQFEELFTLAPEAEADLFLDALIDLTEDGRVSVVLALRADFYDRPLSHPSFAPAFSRSVLSVTPMAPEELEAAIVEPARRAGVEVAPALLARLVADVGDHPGSLPLLQYVLTGMFERRRTRVLDLDLYGELRGIRGALTGTADELFAELDEAGRALARQVFLRLVSVAGARVARRRAPVRELIGLGADPVALEAVLRRFGAARLLTFDREPEGATVEVAHEALLGEWGRLGSWIEEHRSDLSRRHALGAAAEEWEASGRQVDYLLGGDRLAQTERWAASTGLELSAGETAFLDASVARRRAVEEAEAVRLRHERDLARRARRRLWGAAAALALVAATLTYTYLVLRPAPPPDLAVVLVGGPGGMNAQFLAGLEQARAELGLDVEGVLVADPDSVVPELSRLAEAGAGTVIVVGEYFSEAHRLADTHPEVRFVIADFDPEVASEDPFWESEVDLRPRPNVRYLLLDQGEGSFLVGVIAALTTETGAVGFVGGRDVPIIWEFQAAYEAGVRWVDAEVEVLVTYLSPFEDGWNSPTLGAVAAEEMLEAGADVVFHAAGGSGGGVFEAVSQFDVEGRHGVWAIGVDQDQYLEIESWVETGGLPPEQGRVLQSYILTSMVKRYDVLVRHVAGDVAAGRFVPGVEVLGLEEGAIGYATSGGFVDHLADELAPIEAKLAAGEIEVPARPEHRGELLWAGWGRWEEPGPPRRDWGATVGDR